MKFKKPGKSFFNILYKAARIYVHIHYILCDVNYGIPYRCTWLANYGNMYMVKGTRYTLPTGRPARIPAGTKRNGGNEQMRITKAMIYKKHGITFKDSKILSPIGFIPELLKDGNSKTGKAVYTWSVLPGTGKYTLIINGEEIVICGTCICDCVGCYAKTGFYKQNNVIESMARNTYLVNKYPDFVYRAISAQLEIIGRGEIRIHAAGDFNTADPESYSRLWFRIAKENPTFRFWTYTKLSKYETLFDSVKNANIVRSIIPHVGINFGHCDYIINAYYTLKSLNQEVYICKCGIDKNQHCEKCGICSAYKYVLFVEHSTAYKAEEDPLFEKLCEIVNNQ